MNDGELITLLLANYQEQYGIYRTLLSDLTAGLPANGRQPDMARVIAVLEARKLAFEKIKAIDERIQYNKVGWDRRKNDLHSIEAETLRTLLSNIRLILSQVMEANDRLESAVKQSMGKG